MTTAYAGTVKTALFAAGILLAAVPAQAAVKVCRGPQSSGIVVASTEIEAKRKAIEAWTLKVRIGGDPRFSGWPIAVRKVLRCSPPKDGRVACIAIGTPCVVQQAPPKKNDKLKPGRGPAIEA